MDSCNKLTPSVLQIWFLFHVKLQYLVKVDQPAGLVWSHPQKRMFYWNRCELLSVVPLCQSSAKLEKAEILQMTVDHLKMLQATGGKGTHITPYYHSMIFYAMVTTADW